MVSRPCKRLTDKLQKIKRKKKVGRGCCLLLKLRVKYSGYADTVTVVKNISKDVKVGFPRTEF